MAHQNSRQDSRVNQAQANAVMTTEDRQTFQFIEMLPAGLGILAKPLSERNELDVQSFIASSLDEAVYDAKAGASEADDLVKLYLNERAKLLDLGIQRIKSKYPDLEY